MLINRTTEELAGVPCPRIWIVFVLISLLTGSVSAADENGTALHQTTPEENAIRDRIEQAQKRQHEAFSSLADMERALVLFCDFEQDNMVYLGNGGFFHVDLPKDHYQEGRHGRGFFFEKPGDNQLPPKIADVETDITGFEPIKDAEIKSVDEQTRFGKKAISVKLPSVGSGFRTVPVRTTYATPMTGPHQGKLWRLLASCYVKGPKGAKVRIEVAPIQEDAKTIFEKSGKKKEMQNAGVQGEAAPAIFPDKIEPQQIALSGEWERIACGFVLDVTKKDVMTTFSLVSEEAAMMTLLADGFQFEESLAHIAYDGVPASWIPGGTRRPATPVQIGSPFADSFPLREGSVAFWFYTPQNSNLRGPNGGPCLAFGNTQYANGWQFGGTFRAGGEVSPFAVSGEDKWHHIAMTWDEKKAYVYADGTLFKEPFERKTCNLAVPLNSVFMIGGSLLPVGSANSVIDDVLVFKRKLTDGEIMSLANAKSSPHITTSTLLFAPTGRSVFYRDENKATFDFRIKSLQARETPSVDVDFCIGDAIYSHQSIKTEGGMATIRFEFSPSQLKSGHYLVRLAGSGKTFNGYWETPVDIIPALRPDHYMLSTWGGAADAEWIPLYKRIGLNTIDSSVPIAEEVGKLGFLYGWHNDYCATHRNPAIWNASSKSYINDQLLASDLTPEVKRRAPYPNWKLTLVNSELGLGGCPRSTAFDSLAQKSLGFPIPPAENWQIGHPMFFRFPENRQPDANGIYRNCQELNFLRWVFANGTDGMTRLNSEIAKFIHKTRPDVKVWNDPILYACQTTGLDAGGQWCYETASERLVGDFEEAAALVHGNHKEFYCTLGMWYALSPVFGATVPISDLKKLLSEQQFRQMLDNMNNARRAEEAGGEAAAQSALSETIKANLAPTGDDMIQQAWISIAYIPSDGLNYWFLDGLLHGLKRDAVRGTKGEVVHYAEPGSDERLGAALKNDILPIGTMLKGVRNAQRPFALLVPESSRWPLTGTGGMWWWGTEHYVNQWKLWLGTTGIPYDFIFDGNITPGSLAKYQAIFFPMAQYVEKRIYEELIAAGKGGTKIVTDKYCAQEYPNMERWEQEYKYGPQLPPTEKEQYDNATLEPLESLRGALLPNLDAYAIGKEGPVLLNVREYHGAKYVVVINNNRQLGSYTKWTKVPAFKPYGKAQNAMVYLKVPADSAVYDFVESRKLPVKALGNHLMVEIGLPPHAGRLLCVYPRAFEKLAVSPHGRLRRGMPMTMRLAVLDKNGNPMKGRQLVNVRVLDPAGKEHDETGIYRLEDGKADIPFHPSLNEAVGQWRIEVVERTSGLNTFHVLEVKE